MGVLVATGEMSFTSGPQTIFIKPPSSNGESCELTASENLVRCCEKLDFFGGGVGS